MDPLLQNQGSGFPRGQESKKTVPVGRSLSCHQLLRGIKNGKDKKRHYLPGANNRSVKRLHKSDVLEETTGRQN